MSLNFSKDKNATTLVSTVSKSNASYFQVAILMVISGLFYWFMILPKQSEIQKKQEELNKLETQQNSLRTNVNNLKKLTESISSNKEKIRKLDEALPLNGKVFGINLVLEDYARQAGVNLQPNALSIKSGYVIAGNIPTLESPFGVKRSLQKLSTTLEVTGTLQQLINFLKKIENSPRLIQVNNLDIAQGSEGFLTLNISIDTFYYE